MILDIYNFGEILMSHPAEKEAFSMAKAYILGTPDKVKTISWGLRE